ncbi:ribonuclease HII [Candidatus Parcubacteria bacterium]|nr:ribonuclease HII [Candidatus Parcubacteria bacterium]
MTPKLTRQIVGIDEAGRGPLAGPVAVGGVVIKAGFNKKFFKGIKDSKKLTPEERGLWYLLALEAKRQDNLDFAVSLVSERIIDKHGIAYAIRLGIKRVIEKLGIDTQAQIFLDGGIKAPERFPHQLTVIRGDEKIPVVSLASICAKVTRDKYMIKLGQKYPDFDFHVHKGYGTLLHRERLKKYGPVEPHRRSFLRNLTLKK